MRVAVVGSRSFSDYNLLAAHLHRVKGVEMIVSGGARGADQLGERWARQHGIQIRIFKPDWQRHGKSAGVIRNREIVDNADMVIAFWDGQSKGTQHTVEIARKQGVAVQVVPF